MAAKIQINIVGQSDTGHVRSRNEDSIDFAVLDQTSAYAILADGMGGHRAGDVASNMAVEQLVARFGSNSPDEAGIISAIQRANLAIYDAAEARPDRQGMGTTLVLARIEDDTLVLAHVGDSRAYQFAQGHLTQLTRDHSLVEQIRASGAPDATDLAASVKRNVLTRALGVAPAVDISMTSLVLHNEGFILLCSDGLTDMLDDTEIAAILDQPLVTVALCQRLIGAANQAGGRDNISVILIHYNLNGH